MATIPDMPGLEGANWSEVSKSILAELPDKLEIAPCAGTAFEHEDFGAFVRALPSVTDGMAEALEAVRAWLLQESIKTESRYRQLSANLRSDPNIPAWARCLLYYRWAQYWQKTGMSPSLFEVLGTRQGSIQGLCRRGRWWVNRSLKTVHVLPVNSLLNQLQKRHSQFDVMKRLSPSVKRDRRRLWLKQVQRIMSPLDASITGPGGFVFVAELNEMEQHAELCPRCHAILLGVSDWLRGSRSCLLIRVRAQSAGEPLHKPLTLDAMDHPHFWPIDGQDVFGLTRLLDPQDLNQLIDRRGIREAITKDIRAGRIEDIDDLGDPKYAESHEGCGEMTL